MNFDSLKPLLDQSLSSRHGILETASDTSFRIFNGFYEGFPSLILDIYASTLLVHDYSDEPNQELTYQLINYLRKRLPWLRTGIQKIRNGKTQDQKRGQILFGENPDRKIKEHDVWYTIDLIMNHDASFYLDTSNLRKWLIKNSKDKTVLNTFAYTGSLGVAAMAGEARKVIQTDRNKKFLNLAKDSYALNHFPIQKQNLIAQDFFPVVSRFKTSKQTFDYVIIDPPIFSSTSKGKVDLENESLRLINKVRPLINDGGILISINNGVYVSGSDYMKILETVCRDGYLEIKELIPVSESFIGYNKTSKPITDPSPFNHSTKIAVLDVKKK